MNVNKIKPIPKYIQRKILAEDDRLNCNTSYVRYFGYLTTIEKELVLITVALRNGKNKSNQRYMKQIAIHGVYSNECLIKDFEYNYMGGFLVGWYQEGLAKKQAYYNDGIWYSANYKYYNPYCVVINQEYALTKKEFRYSVADQYTGHNIIDYLRTYLKYPQTEYLIKLGLGKYAETTLILKQLDKDKHFAKWLIKNKEALINNYYYIRAIMRAYKNKTSLDIEEYKEELKFKLRASSYKEFKKNFISDFEKLTNYIIKKQINIESYVDYYNACNYLELDMNLDKNIFPKDFQRWHDIRIDEYNTKKALEDKEKRKDLYAKFEEIANKYDELQYNKKSCFIVLIPHSPADLIKEGDTLHHCVGKMNYDQKFIREETLIFFIRNKNKPEIPYVTIEYSLSENKVIQCYGDHDSKPNEDIFKFIKKKWLPYANKQIKQITIAA